MSFDWTIKVTDIVMIGAIVVGPIIAVQLTEWIRRQQNLRDRKEWAFRALMATRNATLAPAHVEALNLVDVLFHSQKPQERKVVDAWKLYLSHLQDRGYPKESWGVRKNELLHELLYEMGMALGYSFDRSHIKSGTYYPEGYSDAEVDQIETRKLWLEILRNERPIKMATSIIPPPGEDGARGFMEMQKLWHSFLSGETSIPVEVKKNKENG